MVVVFAMLWTLCVIETFDHMTTSQRYDIVAVECILYAAIAVFLFKSRTMMQGLVGALRV